MVTGQIDDPSLSARIQADQLKGKENLTLAEQLILASTQETFSYTYKGVTIEVRVPTQGELDAYLKLFNKWTTTEDENESKSMFISLCEIVSGLCVDDSITVELLSSQILGTSFFPKFMNEVIQQEKRTSEEVTAIKGFRKK
jgi:hypothetical protein